MTPSTGLTVDPATNQIVEAGNIDLHSRPMVKNPDGSISTAEYLPPGEQAQPASSLLPPIWQRNDVWDTYNAQREVLPSVLKLKEDAAQPEQDTSWLDYAVAQYDQSNNVLTASYRKLTDGIPVPVRGYDPYTQDAEFLKQNPQAIEAVIHSQSPAETRIITSRLLRDRTQKELLAKHNGLLNFGAGTFAALSDPTTLASMAIPLTMEVGAGRIGAIAAGALSQGAVATGQEVFSADLHPERTDHERAVSVTGATLLTAAFGAWATRVPRAALNDVAEQVDKQATQTFSRPAAGPSTAQEKPPEQLDLLGDKPSTFDLNSSLEARRAAAENPELLISQKRAIESRLAHVSAAAKRIDIPDPAQALAPKELEQLTARKAELEAAQAEVKRKYGISKATDLSRPLTDAPATERSLNTLAAQREFATHADELAQINAKLKPVVDNSPEALIGREQTLLQELEQVNKSIDLPVGAGGDKASGMVYANGTPRGRTIEEHLKYLRERTLAGDNTGAELLKVEKAVDDAHEIQFQLKEVRKTLGEYEAVAAARAQERVLNARLEEVERQLAERPSRIAPEDPVARQLLAKEQEIRALIREIPKKYSLPEDRSISDMVKNLESPEGKLSGNKFTKEQMTWLAARGEEKLLRAGLADVEEKLAASKYKGAKPVTEEELTVARQGIQQDLFSIDEAPFPESIWKKPPEEIPPEAQGPANKLYDETPVPAGTPEQMPVTAAALDTVDSGGAARVFEQTLADRQIATGGGVIAKTLGKISPALRVMTRSSVAKANEMVAKLVEVGAVTKGEQKGLATEHSLQRIVQYETDKALKEANDILDTEYLAYRKTGGKLSRGEVGRKAFEAMNKKDSHSLDVAQKIARKMRPMFNKYLQDMKDRGILADDFEFKGADGSYAPRVWDHEMITKNRTAWDNALFNAFKKRPHLDEAGNPIIKEDYEIVDQVNEATNNVLGTLRGAAANGAIRAAKSTKERSLDVAYDEIKDFLVDDFEKIMKGYVRSVVPQLTSKDIFDEGFEAALKEVTDDYAIAINRAANDTQKAALQAEMAANVEDLRGLYKRAMLQAGPTGNQNSKWITAGKTLRTWAFLRDLGGMAISASVDAGRVMMEHGLTKTIGVMGRYLAQPEFRRMARADAQRMNTALDWILHTRGPSLSDVGDAVETSKAQQILGNSARTFTRLTGLASWNDMMKSVVTIMEQDALIRAAKNPEALTAHQRASFANIGFGTEELYAFRDQIAKHARQEQGVWRLRTDAWDDKGLAKRFELGLGKRADLLVQTQGAADTPLMMDENVAKTIFQFQSFGMGAVHRLMIPAAQGIAAGDLRTANGVAIMLGIGGFSYALREKIAGREPDLSAKRLGLEAVNRSGIVGYLPMYLDAVNDMMHLEDNVGIPKFSQYGHVRGPSDFLGPTYRTGEVLMQGVSRATGDTVPVSQATVETIEKLMPYRNFPGLQRVLHAVEGEVADHYQWDGATSQSFGQRLTEQRPLEQK